MDNSISAQQLVDDFPQLISSTKGNLSTTFSSFSSIEEAPQQSLAYVSQYSDMDKALKSNATVIVAPQKIRDKIVDAKGKTIVFCESVDLTTTLIRRKYFFTTPYTDQQLSGVHPKAFVHETAVLGKNVTIGPGAYVAAQVSIGDGSYVGPNAVIEESSSIGAHSCIHPLAYIGHHSILGEYCEIMPNATIGSEGYGYAQGPDGQNIRTPHVGRVVLGQHVHIGAGSCIDRGTLDDTTIGDHSKLDNLCHIAHNNKIGKSCLLTAKFLTAGSAVIGDHVRAGGRATVAGHKTVTSHVHLAGMAVAHNNVTQPGAYAGYPLEPIKDALRTMSLTTRLAEMRKQLQQIAKIVLKNQK